MDLIESNITFNGITEELFCIEYPGFIDSFPVNDSPISIVRAAENSDNEDHLTLSYRPIQSIANQHSVSSYCQNRNIIVLKVKRDLNGSIVNTRLAGFAPKMFVFRELFDFATASIHDNNLALNICKAKESFGSGIIASIVDVLQNSNTETSDSFNWNSLSIPPYKYSHANLPFSAKDLRSTIKVSTKSKLNRNENSWNISFNEENIPSAPAEDCMSRAKYIPQHHIDIVSEILEKRPIASKFYILHQIQDESIRSNLKYILPSIAYHWKNGPWHLLWTKYGIDPRLDSKYRFYQSIELRNKMFAKELRRGKTVTSIIPDSQSSLTVSVFEQDRRSLSHLFDGENLHLYYLTFQYCDLTYEPLREIVNYPGGIRSIVSSREGWYPDGIAKKLRDIMKLRWFELLKSADLTSLPQHKLEEILDITTPEIEASSSDIQGDWAVLNQTLQSSSMLLNDNNFSEEESDYEIFDY